MLRDADAGQVIRAFGDFVVGGDAMVGFIIFLIIVVIQFIVITRVPKGCGGCCQVYAGRNAG